MSTRHHSGQVTTTIFVEREDKETGDSTEIEVEVEGTFTPEEPCVMYYRDGSGYPGSPASIEDITVLSPGGFELTGSELSQAEEALMEAVPDDDDDGDARYDAMIDRQMEDR